MSASRRTAAWRSPSARVRVSKALSFPPRREGRNTDWGSVFGPAPFLLRGEYPAASRARGSVPQSATIAADHGLAIEGVVPVRAQAGGPGRGPRHVVSPAEAGEVSLRNQCHRQILRDVNPGPRRDDRRNEATSPPACWRIELRDWCGRGLCPRGLTAALVACSSTSPASPGREAGRCRSTRRTTGALR